MLWLGANVMLEYDINDAKELLTSNKGNAIKSLEDVNEQMGKIEHLTPKGQQLFYMCGKKTRPVRVKNVKTALKTQFSLPS